MEGLRPDALEEVIHGRIRLGIMAYLSQQSSASFAELAKALETTNGNLSIHLKKLEAAGYVGIDKQFVDSKPLTTVRMTPRAGRPGSAISMRSPSCSRTLARNGEPGGGRRPSRFVTWCNIPLIAKCSAIIRLRD